MSEEYTREDLIKICELAIVNENDWHDRDTESSQEKIGICWALLKCGCDFEVVYEDSLCKTDEDTIWLYIYSKGFEWFEWAEDNERTYKERIHIYLPTIKRLKEANGKDWY